MSHRLMVVPTVLVTALLVTAQPARADWLLTPFLGITFGADTPSQQVNYGFSAAVLGGGVFGVEFDAALTPNFFDSDSNALQDGNVSTVMANVMVAAPMNGAPLRPYVSGGAGLIHAKATSVGNAFDLNENHLGIDIGAGVIGFLRDNVGVRGDLRYFRAVTDSDGGDGIDFDLGALAFWRGTLGVTFRF